MSRKLTITLLIGALCLVGASSVLAYDEIPMLREKVAAGVLPPMKERLPEEPALCNDMLPENIDLEIGRYGGTLRLVNPFPGGMGDDAFWIAAWEMPLKSPGFRCPDPSKIEGSVLKGFEVSDDQKTITFYMRKGMKWSDGYPFNTEDVRFWYEDFILNKKLTPLVPLAYKTAGRPDGGVGQLKIIDDYTFQLVFDGPYGGFPVYWANWVVKFDPAHHAKKFHADYTPMEELEPLIQKAGFEKGEWWRLYRQAVLSDANRPEYNGPVYTAYVVTRVTPQKWYLERNPFYWKADAEGNQLPYIDKLEVTISGDIEASTMKILAGEVDLVRHQANIQNLALYKEYADKAGFNVELYPTHAVLGEVFLNLNNEDPVWHQVVGDVRFRKALSLALNREEIIEALYFGYAALPEVIPLREYNPEKANRLLDEMGLDKRDADGYRLGPDGKRFTIPFIVTAFTGEEIPTATIVGQHWGAVGIHTTLKQIDVPLWRKRCAANENYAFTFWCHYAMWPWFPSPANFLGYTGGYYTYGPLWYQWYESSGKAGEEPPVEYKELRRLWAEINETIDAKVHIDNWNGIRDILADQVYIIPIIDNTELPVISSKKLGNVAHGGIQIGVAAAAEQMFFKE